METEPFRIDGPDLLLRLKVTPGARTPGFDGVHCDADGRPALRLKVRAKALDGAAHEDVIAALAKALTRPRSAIAIEAGATARLKSLRIGGDPAVLIARLKELAAP